MQHPYTRLSEQGFSKGQILGNVREDGKFHLVKCNWSSSSGVCDCLSSGSYAPGKQDGDRERELTRWLPKPPGIDIDTKLVSVIQGLWKAGIETTECCQGHSGKERYSGYICFSDSVSARKFHAAMCRLNTEPWLGKEHDLAKFPPLYMAMLDARWRLDPKEGSRLSIGFVFESSCDDDEDSCDLLVEMVANVFPK